MKLNITTNFYTLSSLNLIFLKSNSQLIFYCTWIYWRSYDLSWELYNLPFLSSDEADLDWQDDDLFLLSFLRARKFDVKRAFQLMKTFYTVMGKHRELYLEFNYEDVARTVEDQIIGFLPYRDSEGCVILVIRTGELSNILCVQDSHKKSRNAWKLIIQLIRCNSYSQKKLLFQNPENHLLLSILLYRIRKKNPKNNNFLLLRQCHFLTIIVLSLFMLKYRYFIVK